MRPPPEGEPKMWTKGMENGAAKRESILLVDPDETVRLLVREYL